MQSITGFNRGGLRRITFRLSPSCATYSKRYTRHKQSYFCPEK
ncbi:hypothetical protein PAMC26577_34605 [Caballeronia sordidicola]|uniref:Uncharacterized protein n=1 Tax=Caballeronia sordidicola TaxID=196367 RepID=A0A242M9Z9_CABSO|nr:hypothetical protein PAMC26577_34605 [Caballeronia sordidicola]